MRQTIVTLPDSNGLAASPSNHDLLQLADVLRFIGFIRRHMYRLLLGVAIGSTLGAIYFAICPRLYQSKSQLLVVRKNPLIVQGMPSAVPRGVDVMSTHIAVITSPWLANRVLSNGRLSSLMTFAGKKNSVASLIGSLDVVHHSRDIHVPYSGSNVIEFSFRGPHSHECQDILNAVIDAYRQYLNESSRIANQDAFSLITNKANQIRQGLENKEHDYKVFRTTAYKQLTSGHSTGIAQQLLANIHSSQVELEVRSAEAMSRLKAWRKALRNGSNSIAVRAMLPESLKPTSNYNLAEKLLPLMEEEQETQRAVRSGASHPKVKALRRKIELTYQLSSTPIPRQLGSLPAKNSVDRLQASNPVAEYTLIVEQELENILASGRSLKQEFERGQEELERELEREREEARKLAEFNLESERFTKAIAHDQQLYDALMSQLQRVEIDIASGAYSTTLIAPPSDAQLTAPRPMLVFSCSIFLGIVGGFAYAVSAEIANRLLCSTQEVVRSLNVPVLGQIPTVESKGEPLHRRIARLTQGPALCTLRSPDSSVAEAYRGLRTALYFHAERQPLKIIAITSPNVGDGTSTLTANLAVSIAQSGRRVLLIDANLHRPRVHEIFGISEDKGLATVLAGKCAPNDAIAECGVAGLSILPCGPRPSRPADLLSDPTLKEVFDALRKRFDYILVDTPGMLAVADSQILATNSDGVLLTIRCGQKGGLAVARAGDMLEQSGANVLGVVLNGASPRDQAVLGDYEFLKNGTAGNQLARTLESDKSSVQTNGSGSTTWR